MSYTTIGIAGGTGAGKSTLIEQLAEESQSPVSTLSMDDYYHDLAHLSVAQRAQADFDRLAALDIELFVSHLELLKAGQAVASPVYDFACHTRKSETRPVVPAPIILVDGILLLAAETVRPFLDLAIYIRLDDSTRLARRTERDRLQRGRHPGAVSRQWHDSVHPAHVELVEPSAEQADLVLNSQDFDRVIRTLRALLH